MSTINLNKVKKVCGILAIENVLPKKTLVTMIDKSGHSQRVSGEKIEALMDADHPAANQLAQDHILSELTAGVSDRKYAALVIWSNLTSDEKLEAAKRLGDTELVKSMDANAKAIAQLLGADVKQLQAEYKSASEVNDGKGRGRKAVQTPDIDPDAF